MAIKNEQFLEWVSEIQALAQAGLTYSTNPFDIERFTRLRSIVSDMAAQATDQSFEVLSKIFTLQNGYPTPKVDVRSFVLKDDKILLVRERSDNRWTLPGGFADVNETPSQVARRETKEETGFDVTPNRLLALWDTLKHNYPLQWPHIYKFVFYCELIGGESQTNVEISEINFFSIDALPELSSQRITAKQLGILYEMICNNTIRTEFD